MGPARGGFAAEGRGKCLARLGVKLREGGLWAGGRGWQGMGGEWGAPLCAASGRRSRRRSREAAWLLAFCAWFAAGPLWRPLTSYPRIVS